jgi:hypothetical protein
MSELVFTTSKCAPLMTNSRSKTLDMSDPTLYSKNVQGLGRRSAKMYRAWGGDQQKCTGPGVGISHVHIFYKLLKLYHGK